MIAQKMNIPILGKMSKGVPREKWLQTNTFSLLLARYSRKHKASFMTWT